MSRVKNALRRVARGGVIVATALLALAPVAAIDVPGSGNGRQASPSITACPPTDPNYPACTVQTDCAYRVKATLTASPSTVQVGESATLRWSVTYPSDCARRDLTLGGQKVAAKGSLLVTPLATQPYLLKLGPITVATATIRVDLPRTVRILGNTPEWERVLVQALGTPNTVVLLASNVDMDLSGQENIRIREGVTLMGEGLASAPARDARHLGPRLYTTSVPSPLFAINCYSAYTGDNVRLGGFRLQGPQLGIERDDDKYARGISINSCRGIEIANMELSGWSGQAIYLRGTDPRMLNPNGVWIHDNFFHHNQHTGGFGYGVDVNAGAKALIERNVFDFNRHAIAGSGEPGTGYNAQLNLVLRGGGVHDGWFNYYTHQFDVHGDQHCPDIPFYDEHTYNCGNAGDEFWFNANAFQYRNDRAIKLRGTPRVGAYIFRNMFPHSSLDDALEPTSRTNVVVGANSVSVDSFGDYGVCDFDGDGRDDLFLPTGASWWYSSGGKMHWVFLNAQTERLQQVGLGDFDGDRRCDVFAVRGGRWEISSGGTGAWTPLPGGYTVPFNQLAFGDFNGDGRKDVFRRAPDGNWLAVSPGVYDWVDLWRSSLPLSGLRFGDLDGDRVTDVLSLEGGTWSVSWRGQGPSVALPANRSESLSSVLIGDVDGIAGDDVVRFVSNVTSGHWEVSSSGSTPWQRLATVDWPADAVQGQLMGSYIGQFDAAPGADLLAIDADRRGRLHSSARPGFAVHSLYAY